MTADNEIELGELLAADEPGPARDVAQAIKRAHNDNRMTWISVNGLRCAAIVPSEMGRALDGLDEIPRPGSVAYGGNGLGGNGSGGIVGDGAGAVSGPGQ